MIMTVRELEFMIEKASKIYYTGEWEGQTGLQPVMSDSRFDQYVTWLRRLNPHSPVLQKVGTGDNPKKTSGNKVVHEHGGMNSIDNKPRDFSAIPDNLKKGVRIAAKLDGLSGVIHIVNGKFVRCATRGDGNMGVDQTDKFVAIMKRCGGINLPEEIICEIRGEFVISWANWNIMVESGTQYKNPRNAAAGIINAKEILSDIQYLDFIPYKIIWDKTGFFSLSLLDEMGDCPFCVAFSGFARLPKMLMVEYTHEELIDMYNGWKLLWPCDGIVITSTTVMRNGEGSRFYTEVAFKFETLKKATVVKSVVWELSKQSLLIPVADLEPVDIDGSTIQRVACHNAKYVQDNEIVSGTQVQIMKSGEIIPMITDILSVPVYNKEEVLPKVCPLCDSEVVWKGVNIGCDNPQCGNVDYQNLKVWINALGRMDGIADTLMFKYLDNFGIESIGQIYRIEPNIVIHRLQDEGVQANKFLQVFDKLKNSPVVLGDALKALNIPRLGDKTADKLGNDSAFIDLIKEVQTFYLQSGDKNFDIAIDNDRWKLVITTVVGESTANSIIDSMEKIYNLKYLVDRIIYPEVGNTSVELIPVCITGSLSMSRKTFVDLLKQNGFVVKEDITKKTAMLITNEASGTSAKHKKADELGIQKITESDFIELLKG